VVRIKYTGSIQSEDDLKPTFFRRLLQALIPHGASVVTSPTGIALSPDEQRLYVACGAQGRITVIDLKEQGVTHFSLSGKDLPASTPGVALDADENVFISDRLANSIYVFDKRGSFIRKFGKEKLISPTSIAFDRKGQVLYVISGGSGREHPHTVEAFSRTGEHIRTLGGERSEQPGRFNFPQHLTVAPNGDLWVSDMLNFRVQVFDPEGRQKQSFGRLGTGGAGAFDKIKGIAFDTFGNIYVVDGQQGVHIFNPQLAPLLLFGGPPITNVLGGIVIDSKNQIFVTDFGLNRVHRFQLVNTEAKDSYTPAPAPPSPPASPPHASTPAAQPAP
jgi:DNA-binding beta-propeller fold protein YncE